MNKYMIIPILAFLIFTSHLMAQVTEYKRNILSLNYSSSAKLSQYVQNGNTLSNTDKNTQNLMFVDDMKSVLSLSDTTIDSSLLGQLRQSTPIKLTYDSLLARIKNQDVVIINEAHNRIAPRCFIYNLLPKLKELGFTHIAMETFTTKVSNKLDLSTGYYTTEPIMGKIFRKAMELGMIPVSYESQNDNQLVRDSIQAINLYNQIKNSNGISKTIVICGYGHLIEWSNSNKNKMMGEYFKEISGIDPYTIDQTTIAENCNSKFFRTYFEAFRSSEITIYDGRNGGISEIMIPLCDIYVLNPKTIFRNNRPICILLDSERVFKRIINVPKKAVLAQAYMSKEYKEKKKFNQIIPIDQTTYFDKSTCNLALKPNEKYYIVFRNGKNEVIKKIKLHI